MEASTLWQLNLFGLSILSGAGFALAWDWCDLIRLGRIQTFVVDVTLFVLLGAWNFLFLLYWLDGRVRFFVFLAEALGFTLYMLLLHPVTKLIQKILYKILSPIYGVIKKLLYYIFLPIKKGCQYCKKTLKNIGKRGYNLSVSMFAWSKRVPKWKRKKPKEEESENISS